MLQRFFRHFLEATPQTLLGQTSTNSDARTQGNISTQMFLDQFLDRERTDGTLNGPTSLAWMDHWRRYLESQGVEFNHGTLEGFIVFDDQTIWPKVRRHFNEAQEPMNVEDEKKTTVLVRDYYVVALPLDRIQQIIREHNARGSRLQGEDFDRIESFDTGDPTQPHPGGEFAHMSGIQYYFGSDVHCVEGHIAYSDAEWGLSSISQPQFWQRKRGWWDGYRGVISVDMTSWHVASKKLGRVAWHCTKEEIAEEVWNQVSRTLPNTDRLVPPPLFYHLDENLCLDESEKPYRNKAPFLLTRPGVYRKRPGRLNGDRGYEVYYGNLVFAGVYMATHTRMTTMEAANESGRHAVNGLLETDTFVGSRCRVWNPENNEHPDLRSLVDLDRELFRCGLQHFLDILELKKLPRRFLRPDPDLSGYALPVLGRRAAEITDGGSR